MTDDVPHFDDAGRLIASRYDDVYFSAEDGLAETRHVFLEGNRLAERFAAMKKGEVFTIGETGFGTGLNFLAAWQFFEQHATSDARLEFVSIEGFPLGAETMRRALSPWAELAPCRDALLAQWGPLWPGLHRFRFADGRVRLTLLVGEAAEAMASIDASVDGWFLDGFAPARNPEMWREAVFEQVARLSRGDATLATYTAAGFVRRGLAAVGFDVEKLPGFGTKRDMTVGRYVAERVPPLAVACKAAREPILDADRVALQATANGSMRAVVIGASIAGAFAARSLAERGCTVTVIERQRLTDGVLPTLAPRHAVLQPKISDINDPAGRWLREGYAAAMALLRSDRGLAERSGWQRCGTFQAAVDARVEKKLRRFVEQFGPSGLCRWIERGQTEAELGVGLPVGGVLVEEAGVLRPAGLCAGLLGHERITACYGIEAQALQRVAGAWRVSCNGGAVEEAPAVVVANALDALRFGQTRHLALKPVRGQVTLLDSEQASGHAGVLSGLRCALFYGGYVLPAVDGVQTLGASFVPGDSDTVWRDSEHADVCGKLARVLSEAADDLHAMANPSGWVGLRTTTPTHRCYAEQIEPGLFVSLGHGSHGIASAAMASEVITSLIVSGTW